MKIKETKEKVVTYVKNHKVEIVSAMAIAAASYAGCCMAYNKGFSDGTIYGFDKLGTEVVNAGVDGFRVRDTETDEKFILTAKSYED